MTLKRALIPFLFLHGNEAYDGRTTLSIFEIPHEDIVYTFHSIQFILIIHVRHTPICAIIERNFANMSKQTKHAHPNMDEAKDLQHVTK